MVAYITYNVTNGQIVSIPKPGQIIKDINNFTQYEYFIDPQPIKYVEEKQVRGMADQQRDTAKTDNGGLEDFELDIKVEET